VSGTDDELVLVGRVGKPHGLRGAFFVEGASEDPGRFVRGASVLVDGVPLKIVDAKRGAGGRPVIQFDGPAARGALLQVPRAELPVPDEGSFYVFELIGLPVEEDGGRALGSVREVLPGLANDVLELDTGVLLPLVEDCVLSVDVPGRLIVVAPGYANPE
jgi:16S rRNA processing protein RimM